MSRNVGRLLARSLLAATREEASRVAVDELRRRGVSDVQIEELLNEGELRRRLARAAAKAVEHGVQALVPVAVPDPVRTSAQRVAGDTVRRFVEEFRRPRRKNKCRAKRT